MENKDAAFASKAQSRLCFALKNRGKNEGWNCKEWADKTDYSELPEKKRKTKVDKKEKTGAFFSKVAAFSTGLFFEKEALMDEGMANILSEMGQPTEDRGVDPLAEKMQLNDDSQLAGRVDMKPNSSPQDVRKELLDINTNLARSMKSLAALQKMISETVMKEEGTPSTPTHAVNVSKF